MAVGPIAVRGSTFGQFAVVLLDEPVGQFLGADEVRGDQVVLIVHQVLACHHQIEHTGGIRRLLLAFLLHGWIGFDPAEQIHQLVEQRDIRHRPRPAVLAPQ